MMPKTHIILGAIFSIVVYLLFPEAGLLGVLIIFLSSFLIDVDHYILFVKRAKNSNLKESFLYWKDIVRKEALIKKKQGHLVKAPLTAFHTMEFLLLIAILALFSEIFFFVLVGFLFHHLLDIIDLWRREVLSVRQYSLLLSIFFRSKRYKYI